MRGWFSRSLDHLPKEENRGCGKGRKKMKVDCVQLRDRNVCLSFLNLGSSSEFANTFCFDPEQVS